MSITILDEKDKRELQNQIDDLKENGGGGTVTDEQVEAIIENYMLENRVEPSEDDIPKVFFGGALQQTKTEAVVPFRYISKTEDISGYAEIKAQGNSSMGYPKKNQTVKMFKDAECTEKMKVDFKGWGKQNKHCYKANWIDLTHSRNVVSARLWADVVKSRSNYDELPEELRTSPNQGAVDGFPIKVYANGIYQGRYTLNIPKDKWMSNMDDELDNHCILCGENYVSGCFRALAKIDESDWTDEIHDTVPASIKTRWNEVISFVMNSTDDEFKTNLGDYFDIESLIDYHLFGLLSCGLDAYGKNQLYMTYDGQKWFASMYDMDSTWGLWWNGSSFVSASYDRSVYQDFKDGEGNLLYIRLEQLFGEELKARWADLKNGVLSVDNIINRFERFTDIVPLDLVKEDYASTTNSGLFVGIPSKDTNNIQQIRAFVLARYAWTNTYISSLSYVPCTGITLSADSLLFTTGENQILTATVEPENSTDVVAWETSAPDVATVNNGVVTPLANGNAIITATAGGLSASCQVIVELEVTTNYTITRNLKNCVSDNEATSIVDSASLSEIIIADDNHSMNGASVTVTMGGVDVTSAYSSSMYTNGAINIEKVTGDVVISVEAVAVNALCPLENGVKVFDNGVTLTVTHGYHVKIETTDNVPSALRLNLSRLSNNGTDASSTNNWKCADTMFTLNIGDTFTRKQRNCISNNGYRFTLNGGVSNGTGEIANGDFWSMTANDEKTFTASSARNVSSIISWSTPAANTVTEFDMEIYVNDVRYV